MWDGVRNRWVYTAKDLFDSRDSEDEVLEWRRNSIRDLRVRERKRDEWWEWRLDERDRSNNVSKGIVGCGRGRDKSRETHREVHDREFPYHVRGE